MRASPSYFTGGAVRCYFIDSFGDGGCDVDDDGGGDDDDAQVK